MVYLTGGLTMRPIDADALVKDFNICFGGVSHAVIAKNLIDNAPTIEAEPVRHGRWEPWSPKILGMEYSYDTMECSLCGKTLHNARLFANYCPNCGAKMDSEV